MSEPIRVLHVITGMEHGGAESFIMNMYRNIDREKVQFDFLLRSNRMLHGDELTKMGSRIYYTASIPTHYIKNYFQTVKFFKKHQYQIIHVHANALLYVSVLKIAKRAGVKCRIMHSHNTSMFYSKTKPVHMFNKRHIEQIATHCFACSESAGQWMFNKEYRIIRNGIDIERFAFRKESRKRIRQEFSIPERALVLGHVGHLTSVKNQRFAIDVLSEIHEMGKTAYLVLVGEGGLEQELKQYAEQKSLNNYVFFTGGRKDVPDILSAFDVFVFPSLHEGLPISILEAQANGLVCVCSEAVPLDSIPTDSIHQLSLELGPLDWGKSILNLNCSRIDTTAQLIELGFDSKSQAKELQEFYLSVAGDEK